MPIDVPQLPFHELAPTPPMGWNSWDCYGTAVTEFQTKANADYMAKKLRRVGYEYVVVDIQWYEPNATGHDYVKGAKLTLDANGRLLPATNKFPSAAKDAGFKPLADYLHAKKLKLGIHLMRGIPRQAVEQNLPILGTSLHAKDIANVSDTCKWNPDMFGVDMTRPGAQAYYDSVFKLIASWDVDFVKVDDLSRPYAEHVPEIEAIRRAIDASGRPMVLSTSPGETPIEFGQHVASHANLWRISDDFWDSWPLLVQQFARCAKWTSFVGDGFYPDADMLPVGAVRVAKNGWTKFTHDEQYTLLTLWSMCRSPLMIGGDLPRNDDFTLDLLANEEVIAVDQHGRNGRQLSRDANGVTWVADVPNSGEKYVALFNLADAPATRPAELPTLSVRLADVGLSGRVSARDLWRRKDLGVIDGSFVAPVAYHGCVLVRLTPLQ